MNKSILRFALPFVAVSLAACGSSEPPTVSFTASPSSFASGAKTTLTVTTTDFELREPGTHDDGHGLTRQGLTLADDGAHHEDGEYPDGGHFHVYLDSVLTDPLDIEGSKGVAHQGWEPMVAVTVTTSTLGAHKLILRLHNDDHTIIEPQITAESAITIVP